GAWMSIETPTEHELTALAVSERLGIAEHEVPVYTGAAAGLLGSWSVVEGLHAESESARPAATRSSSRPVDADNPLNAWYVTTDIGPTASGPLDGLTVAVKDNIAVAGVPMMNGSAMLDGYTPSRDATVVSRLLEAGAAVIGKAVCEDLCFSGGSHTARGGPVRNPWALDRSSGGSSAGSAALVAAGEVDLAHGGDQGGSIRIPASFCGVVGHKPTFGLVPYTGAFPIESSIDHVGPITRSVSDAALMLGVLAGPDGLDPRQGADVARPDYLGALRFGARGLRVGVLSEGFGRAESEPQVDETVRAAVAALAGAGVEADEVSIPWHLHGSAIWDVISVEGATGQMIDGNGYGMNYKGLYDPEQIDFYGRRWREDPSQFSETVKLVLMAGRYALTRHHGKHYAMAQNLVPRLTAAYDEQLSRFDVLVLPTTPMRSTVLPAAGAPLEEQLGRALEMLGNTAPFNVTGHPACSVPAGVVDGLPVGLMVVGKHHDDATVLRVAHAVEQAVGTFPAPHREGVIA
ncbi:MAG: amidase, partial [Aeromicrobium sp.]